MSFLRCFRCWCGWGFLLGVVGCVVAILMADGMIVSSAEGRIFSRAMEVPEGGTALVLGCSPTLANGRKNLYFEYRMEAAAGLFHAGRVKNIIVSGDNGRPTYDEPSAMREALVARGVPRGRIYLDYAGFRTLDSVVRAKEVFGRKRIVVVSQRFHNERAIYLATENGVDAVGYDATDVVAVAGLKTRVREKLARVKTVLDVKVLGTKPRFLGVAVVVE